ncbi:hypothetical protein IFO70_08880 [Phormidium tenue FACHB-886]|nr:hypothetical protein [Phormidium tenue FACHB-886]
MPRPSSKRTADQPQTPGRKQIPEKCRRCAMLSIEQVRQLHGAEGDGCYDTAVCPSRRSYARHRDRRNHARSLKRRETLPETLIVDTAAFADICFAVLMVYRKPGAETPIHAIGAEIWKGQEKQAVVPPIHCVGMVPSQVHAYVGKMLEALETHYDIKKFASQERLDVELCPLRPCPHHPHR